MKLDADVKQYIAREVQTAITRKTALEPSMSSNMQFSQEMAGRIASAKQNLSDDGAMGLTDDQTEIFEEILYTLKSIAATDKNTAKERQQIRKMLAQFIAFSEVEKDKINEEIKVKKEELEKLKDTGELGEQEKKKRMELFDEMKKLVEKLNKEEKKQKEAAALDPGTGRTGMTAKERLKKELTSDLNIMFPGMNWKQKDGESFGGMVKRTAGDVLRPFSGKLPPDPNADPNQLDLDLRKPFFQRMKEGTTSVADALFGRAAPEEPSMAQLAAKEKAKMDVNAQIEKIGQAEKKNNPQLGLFTDQPPTTAPPAPPTIEELFKAEEPSLASDVEQARLRYEAFATYEKNKPQYTAEDIEKMFAVDGDIKPTAEPSIEELFAVDGDIKPTAEPSIEELFAVDGEAKTPSVSPVTSAVVAAPAKKKRSSSKNTAEEIDKVISQVVTKKLGSIFDLLEQTIKKTADEAKTRAEQAAKEAKEKEDEEKDEEKGGDEEGPSVPGNIGPKNPTTPTGGGKGRPRSPRPSRGAARGVARGAVKGAEKAVAKGAAKALTKTAGKTLLKKIPVVGALAGLAFGASRLMGGDFLGAGSEVASGLAGTIPGIGTAASVGIDAALAARDMASSAQVGSQDTGVADILEQMTEMDRSAPPDATPMVAEVANPAPIAPSRSQMIQSPSAPASMIRSPENSFVRFQDKRVARI